MSNQAQNPKDETVLELGDYELFGIQGLAFVEVGLVRTGNGATKEES
jgi:hypothetical protein